MSQRAGRGDAMTSTQRRTKIIATLGPACRETEVLERMIRAGMDVARVNFSHGTHDEHRERVRRVREASAKIGREIGVLGDLQGPKIRIQQFADGAITLNEGDQIALDPDHDSTAGTGDVVGISYRELADDVSGGDVLLLDDGHIVLGVEKIDGQKVHCRVMAGGSLSNHKGINRQGGGLSAAALTDKDRDDIALAVELDIDFLALSFPRDASDVELARKLYQDAGGRGLMVAKIERSEAIDNLEQIVTAADVVMVARGDLGVEAGYASVPGLQKRIIRMARKTNRVAITATQMMESMIKNPVPTRAEVSDVANAVMDGTDAVMLSGETAVGEYPVRAIKAMAEVCKAAEQHQLAHTRSRHRIDSTFEDVDEAIAMAAMYTANHLDVKAIIAWTESGRTTLWMSRIRSDIPIFAFTRHVGTRRRVNMYRGVFPVFFDITQKGTKKIWEQVSQRLLELGLVNDGEMVIFTEGETIGMSGGTNSMKLLAVGGTTAD